MIDRIFRNLRSTAQSVVFRQTGVVTLAVTLLLLAVITIVTLFATNVAFFEQRTANNENRARLAEQAAEYGVNLAGEYLKSKLDVIVSKGTGGWLASGSAKWTACTTSLANSSEYHPCRAAIGSSQLANLYFATLADDTNSSTTDDVADILPVGTISNVGGSAQFPVQMKLDALLCRIDTSDPANPQCDLTPTAGNNIAVTLIASTQLTGEGANATVKEVWGSYSDFTPSSSVPLVASGTVEGLGNAQIVAAPKAGGDSSYSSQGGWAVSIWSPNDVDIDDSSGGVGSVITCETAAYLGQLNRTRIQHNEVVANDDLLTTCATTNDCGCPGLNVDATEGAYEALSGHTGGTKWEGTDILDVDNREGDDDPPDITFFPGKGMDDATDPSDDNLFEWIFNVNYVAQNDSTQANEDAGLGTTDKDCDDWNNPSGPDNMDCALWALHEDLGAEFLTCAQLTAKGANADGLYYVTDGSSCNWPTQLGSPDNNVIIVVDEETTFGGNTVIYGMLFVRSWDNSAEVKGSGNPKIFGSVVVQGDITITGGLDIVYYDWAAKAGKPDDPPRPSFFGKASGSWLDDRDGF